MCVEETSDFVTIREYGPDGKLLTYRTERDGKPLDSSSESGYSEVRDAQGRILKYSSPNREGSIQETTYDYDKAGRLLSISNDQNTDRTEYHYRADGSNTSVQTFDAKTIEQNQNAVCAGSEWGGTTIGGGVPMGGNVTTTYDKNDNPIELQVQNAEGELVTHIVRTYDAEGRLTEERLLEKNMPTSILSWMSAERQAELTPAQRKAYSKGPYALIKNPLGTTYTYDAAGRITGKRERNVLFDERTAIFYNEQGDKARERKTIETNSIMPMGPSYSFSFEADGKPVISNSGPERPEQDYMPQGSDVRYAYQYDSYSNWIEKVEIRNAGSSLTTRRTITYY